MITQLTVTAYHEAAHAVVGHMQGLKILEVSCVANNGKRGHCTYGHTPDIVSALAGFEAEKILCKGWSAEDRNRIQPGVGGIDDLSEVFEALQVSGQTFQEAGRAVNAACAVARGILEKQWKRIASLAEELIAKGTLDAVSVKRIIEESDSHQ